MRNLIRGIFEARCAVVRQCTHTDMHHAMRGRGRGHVRVSTLGTVLNTVESATCRPDAAAAGTRGPGLLPRVLKTSIHRAGGAAAGSAALAVPIFCGLAAIGLTSYFIFKLIQA